MQRIIEVPMARLLGIKVKAQIGKLPLMVLGVLQCNFPIPPDTDEGDVKLQFTVYTTEGEEVLPSFIPKQVSWNSVGLPEEISRQMVYEALGLPEQSPLDPTFAGPVRKIRSLGEELGEHLKTPMGELDTNDR